jgi:HprK-related kinase A
MTLAELAMPTVGAMMSARGVHLRVPPITVRVRSPLRPFAEQLYALYRDYELISSEDFADIDIRLLPRRGVRQWSQQEAELVVDGTTPFDAFPLDHALPVFEWGLNWVFAHRMNNFLLLHAAAVERDGRAVILPAWPGAGKSTLAASLASRGWRFLSDEFCAVAGGGRHVVPFARPAALKNESIAVMRAFAPDAYIGPGIQGTRKGTVAHFRVPQESVRCGAARARIAAVVFPDFRANEGTYLAPLGPANAFLKLAGNAFNYEVLGETAFRAVARLIRGCPSHVLRFGDLDSAHRALESVIANLPS